MGSLKEKAKSKLDDAANAAKKGGDKVVTKSKEITHEAGKAMEKGGKRLQKV